MNFITLTACARHIAKSADMLVFYDDSRTFGGHEIMFLEGLKGILADRNTNCAVIISAFNAALKERLEAMYESSPRLSLYEIRHSSSRFASVMTFISPFRLIRLFRFLKEIKPRRAIIIQGNIEFSSLGLVAAKLAGIHTVSYIPMTVAHASSKNIFTAICKYPFNEILFRMADEFITISETERDALKRRRENVPVHVVFNGVAVKKSAGTISEHAFRAKYGIPDNKRIIAVIGRIQFAQKGHDILMRAADRYHNLLEGCHFLIVGSGSDENRLKEFVSARRIDSLFTFIPWMDDLKPVYRISDAILMPSRYEGVPLTAIESIMESVPVILSDRIVSLNGLIPQDLFFPLE
ncbi:MAG TPA: glycosyltransferase, partial [Spirochaetota bacterium]|nr:glycosyltransferase [Spirochaetota bacterium]